MSDTQQEQGIVVLDPRFRRLIGPNATLRKLLVEPDGRPLFHEAGIYLPSSRTVALSSNRMPCVKLGQRGAVATVPVDKIPVHIASHNDGAAPPDGILPPLDKEQQKALWEALDVANSLPDHLVLPNGATKWDESHVLWCEQGNDTPSVPSRLVVHNIIDGTTHPVLEGYQGRPFSSLNDVVAHPHTGAFFFTDPDYGVEQDFKHVWDGYAPNALYVWQPKTGEVALLDARYEKPNGVTFLPSPAKDGSGQLLTTDTSRFRFRRDGSMGDFYVDTNGQACIYSYDVSASRPDDELPCVDVGSRRVFAQSTSGIPDGIHPDAQGNVWAGHGDGVHVYAPNGQLIGKFVLPGGKGVANFCWAGEVEPDGHSGCGNSSPSYRLLLFAEDELWEAIVAVNGSD